MGVWGAPQLAPVLLTAEVCLQLLLRRLSQPKCAGCEATVSPRTPVLHLFCLTSSLKRSVTVPHLNLFALLRGGVSAQLIRKPLKAFYSTRRSPT